MYFGATLCNTTLGNGFKNSDHKLKVVVLIYLHSSPIYLTVEWTDKGWYCGAEERFLFQKEAPHNTYTCTALSNGLTQWVAGFAKPWESLLGGGDAHNLLSESRPPLLLSYPHHQQYFSNLTLCSNKWVTLLSFVFPSFGREVFLILDHQHLYIYSI